MEPLLDTPLIAYPTLTEAARLLGVSASTLSRRDDLRAERMGERDRRVPAIEVMRLAAVYRKRSLNEVAADVVEYAEQHAPEQAATVEDQVQRFFAERRGRAPSEGAFLDEARRALPAELYREVERVYRAGGEPLPPLVSAD